MVAVARLRSSSKVVIRLRNLLLVFVAVIISLFYLYEQHLRIDQSTPSPAAHQQVPRRGTIADGAQHVQSSTTLKSNASLKQYHTPAAWMKNSYDTAAPHALEEWTMQVEALPATLRLPIIPKYENLTAWLSASRDRRYPNAEYLFDYNPSIVTIPASQVPFAYRRNAVYLASFRIANRNYCFHPRDRKLMWNDTIPASVDHLGLVLLDVHLRQLASVVIAQSSLIGMNAAEDFRLFQIHEQLYLGSNDQIVSLWLQHPPHDAMLVPTLYASSHPPLWSIYQRTFASCAPCRRQRGVCGKNFNYFATTPSNTSTFVEVWPSAPHNVRHIDLTSSCVRWHEPVVYVQDHEPVPRFPTMMEHHAQPRGDKTNTFTRGRGSTCCIPMQHPRTNETVLVGISHVKTPSQGRKNDTGSGSHLMANHYLSRLYAFQPQPPFRLMAQSNLFCLAFPTISNHLTRLASLVEHTRWRVLNLGHRVGVFPACPRIHFVSGMVRAVDDPSTLLLTYGVNDCFARIVRVAGPDIVHLLFG